MPSRDTPVPPAQFGTFQLPGFPGARYTIGREPAVEAIREIVRSTDTLAVDIETYGLGRDALDIKCVQVGTGDHAVILDPRDPVQKYAISQALAHTEHLVLHNSPFDIPSLAHNQLLTTAQCARMTDTLVYARMANPSDHGGNGLLECAGRYLGTRAANQLEAAMKALGLSRGAGYEKFDIDRPMYVMGAATDVILTSRLLPVVRAAALSRLTSGHPYLKYGVKGEEAQRLVEREQRINRIMLARTVKGLRVDYEYLDDYRSDNADAIELAADHLTEAGIRPGNGQSLMAWLTEQGAVPEDHPRTPKNKTLSTAAPHLERLAHPMAQAFVQHKRLKKVQDDYLVKVVDLADAHDRVHPRVNILGADATGRMSYGDPPVQQFPAPARGILLADPGDEMTSIDWSQIEPVTAANIAQDSTSLKGYESGDKDADFYVPLAKLAGITRKQAKTVVLALMYGEGLAKMAADLGVDTDQAQEWKDAVFASMPKTSQLLHKLRRVGGDYRQVFTMSGRILPVPLGRYDGKWSVMRHKAVNYFVQGSAYDVLAEAIIRVEEAGLAEAIYLAMHDELVVSTSAAEDVRRIMQTPPERLCWLAGRTPVLRTDMKNLGERWAVA